MSLSIIISLALVLFASGPAFIRVQTTEIVPQRSLRLPNTSYPLHYHLHISTDVHLEQLNFTGNSTIDIEIKESTNEIVLHAKNLTNFVITVNDLVTGELFDDLTHSVDPHGNFLIIHPIENYQAFEAGQQLRVEVLYAGLIYEKARGIYRLTYTDAENRTVYVMATQFEPTSARLAFPCYDEPAFKANITIRLTHGAAYTALSNMPVQLSLNHSDNLMRTTQFQSTPVMCTYLAAFVISNFISITDEYRGITQSVFASPTINVERGRKALKNVLRTVPALGDYFGISYPLDKLDHVALNCFYGVAMENWGLITYKEDVILHKEESGFHKILSDIMAQNHEITHQWFGNLVSPEWWSYAWMNEGFATYFAYVITDLLYPDYRVMEFFQTEVVEQAFGSNYIAVRPMTYYVEKESDIVGIFDVITYQKSACILRMFHHAFNQKTFVSGISNFLRDYQYTVANESQLSACLQKVVSADATLNEQPWAKSISDIVTSWTHSTRIPIVNVVRNYQENTITIRQSADNAQSQERWWIPLNFASGSMPDFQRTVVDYFMPPVSEITMTPAELGIDLHRDDWLIVNKQRTGFYHMLYDEENLFKIAKKLQANHTAIHCLNRAALFQDIVPLIENNEISSIGVVLELLKYMRFEEDLVPWNFVYDIIGFFEENLYGTTSQNLYKQFVRHLIAPMFDRLFRGPQPGNLTNNDIFMRQKVLDMACTADLRECLDYAHTQALDYIFRNMKFQANMDFYLMNESILCGGLRYVTDAEFNAIVELLSKADHNSTLYYDLVYALRCTQTRAHLQKYVHLLFSEKFWPLVTYDKDSVDHLSYLYRTNMAARPIIWRFVERNYQLLCRSPYFVETFNGMAQYVWQQYRADFAEIRRTIADELNRASRDAAEGLIALDSPRIGSKIKLSETFRAKYERDINEWLLRNQVTAMYAASAMSARNSSSRSSSLLRFAEQNVRRLLQSMHIL